MSFMNDMSHRPHRPFNVPPTRRIPLVRLAALIDWSWFEEHWAGFFPSTEGRPALHPAWSRA